MKIINEKRLKDVYDVVIVGAGVAGAVIADRLTQAKLNVCMLESGPDIRDRGLYVNRYLKGQVSGNAWPYESFAAAPRPSSDNPNAYFDNVGPEIFDSGYERRVGGTTWHWLGNCPRFVPEDFELKTLYKVGVDWPLGYQDLEPWYEQAEQELGVGGDKTSGCDPYRQSDYPARGIPLAPVDQYFDKVTRRLNLTYKDKTVRLTPTPQARKAELCMGSNSCIPICPMGAKYEAIRHIEKAESQGLELRSKAVVYRLEVNKSGEIHQVKYKNWQGEDQAVTARYVILAANAIETPKILLMSESEQCPKGVANRSDQVGRNLMDHPVRLVYALTKEPSFPYRGPQETGSFLLLREGGERDKRAASLINVQNNGWFWGKQAPESTVKAFLDQGVLGKSLQSAVADHINRQVIFAAIAEQLPNKKNRITLSSKKDALGLPRPSIYYSFDGYLHRGIDDALGCINKIFKLAECRDISFSDRLYGAGHLIGTTRMGVDPESSVVDEFALAHDHPNLYIAGSSLFPTGGTANPTLTLVALALRTAQHLLSRV